MWYKRLEAQKRFSFFFNAASFAGAFGGLLASAIGKMDGIRGYHAWRWIFILEGILTCVVSVIAFFVVADFPEHARWLSDNERAFIVKRLTADQGDSGIESKITWHGILEAFQDWKMIPGALMYFGPTVSAYGNHSLSSSSAHAHYPNQVSHTSFPPSCPRTATPPSPHSSTPSYPGPPPSSSA